MPIYSIYFVGLCFFSKSGNIIKFLRNEKRMTVCSLVKSYIDKLCIFIIPPLRFFKTVAQNGGHLVYGWIVSDLKYLKRNVLVYIVFFTSLGSFDRSNPPLFITLMSVIEFLGSWRAGFCHAAGMYIKCPYQLITRTITFVIRLLSRNSSGKFTFLTASGKSVITGGLQVIIHPQKKTFVM